MATLFGLLRDGRSVTLGSISIARAGGGALGGSEYLPSTS
jgi:hypothetical protein